MQDRFKFRVWCENNQEWEKDTILISNKNMYEIRNDKFTKYTDIDPKNHIINFCTGLKDKNGKLIYEDDIVDTRQGRMVVKFDEYRAMFCMIDPAQNHTETPLYNADYANRLEVIGNIYENTELLEVHHV